jgi:hypothetical protein
MLGSGGGYSKASEWGCRQLSLGRARRARRAQSDASGGTVGNCGYRDDTSFDRKSRRLDVESGVLGHAKSLGGERESGKKLADSHESTDAVQGSVQLVTGMRKSSPMDVKVGSPGSKVRKSRVGG